MRSRAARAWRVHSRGVVCFDDAIQGLQREDLAADIGDFIVRRADGLYAYQLAVVVDDAEAGVTHVVRGADLLESTGRQILLQRLLGLPQPVLRSPKLITEQTQHLPIILDDQHDRGLFLRHVDPH